jgi:hypothetical protein
MITHLNFIAFVPVAPLYAWDKLGLPIPHQRGGTFERVTNPALMLRACDS